MRGILSDIDVPTAHATYLNVTPGRNDGMTIYKLDAPSGVPVDAFWSVTVTMPPVTLGRMSSTPIR